MPLQKNDSILLDIIGATAEGSGVGRYRESEDDKGIAVFVPFTAIGDRIRCRIVKVQKTYAYGRLEALETPSSDRIEEGKLREDCSVYGKCGGCTWRHIQYEAELRYKWQRVADALTRVGGLTLTPRPIIGGDSPEHYRNKAQFPVAAGEHRLLVGFYAPRSHRIVEQRNCPLQPVVFKNILDVVVHWVKKTGATVYNEETGQGLLRHIYIRQAKATGEIMVCLVCTSGKIPEAKMLTQDLTAREPAVVSIMINVNRDDTNVILGDTVYPLWGKDTITDELCGLRFRLSPLSFYQVNHDQAERLYRLAAEAAGLTGEETLLDLYCGTGTIGLSMADKAGQIIGVEIVPSAVEDAKKNAADNGIANARFLCADAARAAAQLSAEGIRPDVVVVDPPRKGCDASALNAIAAMMPKRIVYVSCDPATLARDLKLLGDKGYRTEWVTPVDMFPRTPHVECVALLVSSSS